MKKLAENAQITEGLEGREASLEAQLQTIQRQLSLVKKEMQTVAADTDRTEVSLDGKMVSPALEGNRSNSYRGKRADTQRLRGRRSMNDSDGRVAVTETKRAARQQGNLGEQLGAILEEMDREGTGTVDTETANGQEGAEDMNAVHSNGTYQKPVKKLDHRATFAELKDRWADMDGTQQ